MQKTFVQKAETVIRAWHLIDAKGKILGQVATEIAAKLIGKHKPDYTPHVDCGDIVVVINASDIVVTGSKAQSKQYFNYSGFPGGLKITTFEELLQKYPERVIENAVHGMIPSNKLRTGRMKRLKIYAQAEHVHQAQFGQAQA